MAKNITVIPATQCIHTGAPLQAPPQKRVAGYARVSTGSEEQLTSYEAQVDYYTNYIRSRPDWLFVDVYTDEGISATNTKKRDGFNRMISDALGGKIDLIVTKSVSRFARNTVDSLTTVRKLKEKGVEVYFEKENIYTLDSKGELLITIMSSLAQEESRSISENVTWGQRKRFADGKVSMPYKQFLGYRKGADGLPEIVPEEAQIVCRIYRTFMQGKTANAIAKQLTAQDIPTPGGKTVWQASTINSILQNEKYRGDARLQKKFTVDFLQKKMKVNEGEVPQYYVEHSHPAIIPPAEWDLVQAEIARRKAAGRQYSSGHAFSSKLVCRECGNYYGSKVWHSNDKYRRTIWQCNGKFKGDHRCTTPHLTEDQIKALFLQAFGEVLEDKDSILENCRLIRSILTDCTELSEELRSLASELDVTTELIHKSMEGCITEDSLQASQYEQLAERYEDLHKRHEKTNAEIHCCQDRAMQLDAFIRELEHQSYLPHEFDEKLWLTMIDHITVNSDETVTFVFKDGRAIVEQI